MTEMKSLTLNGSTYDCFVDSVARNQAAQTAVIGLTIGDNITVSDASNFNLTGLRIFGRTTQDGTPTPDTPVELVSAGDSGSITVNVTGDNDANSMTIATPNGLPGIPVSSGGNYTDANGQQWICDEIDFSRGVYVQRIGKLKNHTNLVKTYSNKVGTRIGVLSEDAVYTQSVTKGSVLCDCLPTVIGDTQYNSDVTAIVAANNSILITVEGVLTHNALTEWMVNNPLTVYYVLATPITKPLSGEEIAAYASLHTYRDNTTISNDAGACMQIEYVMDAKKYIDRVIGTGGAALPWLTWVSLPASKWAGSDSLYSQVVTIDGVTPYSKVDLLPSVEQLAIFHNKDVAFVTENEDGVVTVYAIGDKPTLDYTIQAQITEVAV